MIDWSTFERMQETAYASPLTRARGATERFFRQWDAEASIGLTVNA